MFHPEDSAIHKDILLESYQHAIDEGSLEMSLKGALDAFNAVPGVVTVGSCEGHPDREIFCATVDLAVSTAKWNSMQTYIEELLPRDGGISAVGFHYGSLEDEIQQSVRIRTHPMLVKEKAVEPFTRFARKLVELTTPGWSKGDFVVVSAKRHPDDWPHKCHKCGSRKIKIVYSEIAGVKRASRVECFACENNEYRERMNSSACPHCYSKANFDGRGGTFILKATSDSSVTFECSNCKRLYVKENNRPKQVTLLEP